MKSFDLEEALPLLERTPATLRTWLEGLDPTWTQAKETEMEWSPFDVLGHLIHGERTDWMARLDHVRAGRRDQPFPPFDRLAMFELSRGRTMDSLLEEFEQLRTANLSRLRAMEIEADHYGQTGLHPDLGPVSLGQLLATWVVHDLSHIAQIARGMGKQYRAAVGPWRAYLPLLDR